MAGLRTARAPMTPLADFEHLSKGVLAFPAEVNGPNRKPHPLATVIRWADAETWRAWAAVDSAELWQVIALHLYLEPKGLNWERLLHIADREYAGKSVATLFERRYRRACEHLPSGNLPSVEAQELGRSLVRLADFAEWARVNRIPLPAHFPRAAAAGPLEAPPVASQAPTPAPRIDAAQAVASVAVPAPALPAKARNPRALAKAPEGYMRQADLLTIVPFSAATLWRKVKAGTFPAPIRLSAGVTAWRRADVEAWLQARALPARGKRRAAGSAACIRQRSSAE